MSRRWVCRALCSAGAAIVMVGCSSGSPQNGGSSSTAALAENVVDVTVHGSAFAGVPGQLRPGTVTLGFENTGDRTHMAAVGQLNGHRPAELTAYLAQQHGLPDWFPLVGGVDELAAGHRGSWTGGLADGSYALISLSGGDGGVPDAMNGMLAQFTVTGPKVHTTSPTTGATVTLGSGSSLRMTALPAGTTGIQIVNADSVARTVDVTRIRPGSTFDDVLAEARRGTGVPSSLLQLGGTVAPAHGRAVLGIEAAPAGSEYVVFDIDHIQQGAIVHTTVR